LVSLQDPVGISESQLNQFRDLFDVLEDGLNIESESDNFRPMQPLNDRELAPSLCNGFRPKTVFLQHLIASLRIEGYQAECPVPLS